MIKILIADDEKYDRDSIVSILKGEFGEKIEIFEAKNGREAIEISEGVRPDIIIMDIKMPGIDGLKAIAEIKKFQSNPYFIILSAYDYFDFALEAMKQNVKEYILKPFGKKEIIEKIYEGMDYIKLEKEKRRNQIEEQEKIYNLLPVLENELSYSIISQSVKLLDYEIYMKYLDIDFKNSYSMIFDIDKEITNEYIRFSIGDFIKEYISRSYKNIVSYRFTKEIIFFIELGNEDPQGFKLKTEDFAKKISKEVKRVFNTLIRIGIGGSYSGIENMYKSYLEACNLLNCNKNDDISENSIFNIEASAKQGNCDRGKIALFKKVEQYIIDNIKEEIELEKTAARFNLSPFYFSRIFKEILGYNFSDYINKIRINKSKELLILEDLSIKEICYLVGYSDPNYFSKVFKKYEGVTPTDYKINLK